MNEHEVIDIDRVAIVEVYRQQNLEQMKAAVESGEWTQQEAVFIHRKFMESDILQRLVDDDMARMESLLRGQVH